MAAGDSAGFRLAVREVEDSAFEYLQRGLAKSTHKSYQLGIKPFLALCTKYNLIATLESESTLLLFMASLVIGTLHTVMQTSWCSLLKNGHSLNGHCTYVGETETFLHPTVHIHIHILLS